MPKPHQVQTVLQNFIYFYAYAWLKQRHQQLGHRRRMAWHGMAWGMAWHMHSPTARIAPSAPCAVLLTYCSA